MAVRSASAALIALALAGACTTTTAGTTRELPVGLSTLGALLDGCEPDGSEGALVRMRCAGDVVLTLKNRTAGTDEPAFRAEAYDLAQAAGARLAWDQIAVATEGPSGAVDRAQAMLPGDEVKGTLIGTVRSLGGTQVQEVWCTSVDEAGAERCQGLVGGVLGTDARAKAATSSPTPEEAAKPPVATGPANAFGRALSIPTTCKVRPTGSGATATCEDGVSMSWNKLDDIEEATAAAQATLDALDGGAEGEPFACAVAGEPAKCEARESAVAAVTYLDGQPVVVMCVGATEPAKHSLCKALIQWKKEKAK